MESTHKIPFYSTRGILFTILPYYSKLPHWGRVLAPVCKDSLQVWKDQQVELVNLNKITKWKEPDIKELEAAYQETIGNELIFDESLILYLDLYEAEELEFLKKASKFTFMNFKKLYIENIYDEDGVPLALDDFLRYTSPDKVDEFMLAKDSECELDFTT